MKRFFSVLAVSGLFMAAASVWAQSPSSEEILDKEFEDLATEVSTEVQKSEEASTPAKALPEDQILVLTGAKPKQAQAKDPLERLVLSLFVVVIAGAGIFLVARYWSRRKPGLKPHQQIKVITQYPMGPRRSLAIVRVAGESILLGITDHNISMLKSLSLLDEELPEDVPNSFSDEMIRSDMRSHDPEEPFFVGRLKNMRPS
jgi:flagellar protein FliO/FliZ